MLHFGFKNSVLGPQHTFHLVVLLESCGITIFPSISKKKFFIGQLACGLCTINSGESNCSSGICTRLLFRKSRIQALLPTHRKFFHFCYRFQPAGTNAHTKCKETLLVFQLVISTLFTPRVMRAKACKCTHKFHTNMGTWVMIVTTVPNLECAC